MRTAEIQRRFLTYFTERGHTPVPSASLIADDPSTLFVIAGMVPFKPYFLGQQPAPWPRATSVQKCVRTSDIDIIGTTTRHTTFFPMAGNFSFGDYFKAGVIPMAWELLTSAVETGGFGFDPQRLWVTVFEDDDEAFELWTETVGVDADRVQLRDREDNYWHMGTSGPGGPCSEIYYDRGASYGEGGGPAANEERYLEVWNLVFLQYELANVRSKVDFDIVGDLPTRNIDTGMGLERMAVLLQDVDNVFETDQMRPLLDRASLVTGVPYGDSDATDVQLRLVADHVRTAAMLVADGIAPGNEARGYVLRRLLRRAIRTLRLLGVDRPVMPELVGLACEVLGEAHPEVLADAERIVAAAEAEEIAFLDTLRTGSVRFERATADVRGAGGTMLSGDEAFLLHDTYGFPIDLTLEMAREEGLSVDEDGFRTLMSQQRERAQRDSATRKIGSVDASVYRTLRARSGGTEFTGYFEVSSEGSLRGLLVDGEIAEAAGEGSDVEFALDRTPFYAEAGGQLADRGRIRLDDGTVLEVYDAQKPVDGLVVHRGRVLQGRAAVGDTVVSEVDPERRKSVSRAHTATHLVHKALRRALGEQARQAGSLNDAGRFRFDFTSPGAVPEQVVADIETEVNEILLADLPVRAFVTTLAEARSMGAMALFGEKYGDVVRVVEVGDSLELCGGTHAMRSAQIGMIKLLGESSIGAGKRRIEGLVGGDAFGMLAREHLLVQQLTSMLKTTSDSLVERVETAVERTRTLEREIERMRADAVMASAADVAARAVDEFGVSTVLHHAPDGTTADGLRQLALDVRGRFPAERPMVAVAGAVTDGRPLVVVALNDTARSWRLSAVELVREASELLGGGGGGKDDVAQGGGSRPEALDDALATVRHAVGRRVTQ